MAVAANRTRLRALLPSDPLWLKQVHGREVFLANNSRVSPIADAAVTEQTNLVLTVLTADCVPILFCDTQGVQVAATHAGWRGLSAGVIEATVYAMHSSASALMAWIGPCIGATVYEVGEEVRQAFMNDDPTAREAFRPHGRLWLADLVELTRLRLLRVGVTQIYGGSWCTYSDSHRFFSYRRDSVTGRMASLLWKT
jgi:YfiH family protein